MKMTKSELKEMFPTCAEIWELEFENYVVVNIENDYITIDNIQGQLIYEGAL